MRAIALLLLLFAFPASAAQKPVDLAPGRDADKLAVTYTNADGDKLSIWGRHEKDYAVLLAEFRPGGGREFADEMPSYQLDTYKWPLETDWMRDQTAMGRDKWGDAEKSRIWWFVWSDTGNVLRRSMVGHSWLAAKSIIINYRGADGTARTATFSLTGMRDAVVNAIGITVED